MKRFILTTLSLLLMVVASNESAVVAQGHNKNSKVVVNNSSKSNNKNVVVVKNAKTKSVSKLPSKSVTLQFKGASYYRDNSKYYKQVGTKFVVTVPPIGLRVSIIPALHTRFIYNNITYYCAEGVVYQATSDDQFEVVQPEIGMIVPELPTVNVREVNIDGTIYFEFEGVLYKQIPTESGLQYKVSGTLND